MILTHGKNSIHSTLCSSTISVYGEVYSNRTLVMILLVCYYYGTLLLVCFLVSALTASLTFWENFTCLDVTQCMLNRSIIHVALSYMDFNPSSCLPQFLTLGVKVSLYLSLVFTFSLSIYISFNTFTCPHFLCLFL